MVMNKNNHNNNNQYTKRTITNKQKACAGACTAYSCMCLWQYFWACAAVCALTLCCIFAQLTN